MDLQSAHHLATSFEDDIELIMLTLVIGISVSKTAKMKQLVRIGLQEPDWFCWIPECCKRDYRSSSAYCIGDDIFLSIV